MLRHQQRPAHLAAQCCPGRLQHVAAPRLARAAAPAAGANSSSTSCQEPLQPPVAVPAPSPQPGVLAPAGGAPTTSQQQPDPFAWLHDPSRRDARVLRYLQQENEYCKIQLRHLGPLRKQLEEELAEAAWRQAVMQAAQTPAGGAAASLVLSPLSLSQQSSAGGGDVARDGDVYGGYMYRRQPVGATGRVRHVRERAAPPGAVAGAQQQQQQPADAVVVLDEQRRATAAPTACAAAATAAAPASSSSSSSGSSSGYTLCAFAPSPAFDLAAATEALQPEPQGQRRPDRFRLLLLHVGPGAGDGGSSGGGGGGGDASATLVGVQGPGTAAAAGLEAAGRVRPLPLPPLPATGFGDVANSAGAGMGNGTCAQATLLHIAPDGVSGDVGWVALPGAAAAAGGEAGGSSGAALGAGGAAGGAVGGRLYFTRAAQRELWCMDVVPSCAHQHQPGSSRSAITGSSNSSSGGAGAYTVSAPRLVLAEPSGQPMQLVRHGAGLYVECLGNAGVPLEVRWLGQAAVAAAGVGGTDDSRCSSSGRGGSREEEIRREGAGGEAGGVPLLPHAAGRTVAVLPMALSCQGPGLAEALLLWVTDLERPGGCLMLQPQLQPRLQSAAAAQAPEPPPLLLPADPQLRIVHVQVLPAVAAATTAATAAATAAGTGTATAVEGPPGAAAAQAQGLLLVVWEELDPENSGPTGQFQFQELVVQVPGQPPPNAGQPNVRAAGAGRTAACVRVARSRRLAVTGGARHGSLTVRDWDQARGSVSVSYSSMAAPPVVRAIQLLQPEAEPVELRCDGERANFDGSGAGGGSSSSSAEGAATAAAAGSGHWELVMERLWASSHDGAQVPITLCRRRPLAGSRSSNRDTRSGAATAATGGGGSTSSDSGSSSSSQPPGPLLLRVHGAYGMDASLEHQPAVSALLRRGVAVAVAHVRGGGFLGPAWYEGGRGAAAKANSGLDLAAAAAALVRAGVTSPQLMCLEAESAGGWAAGPALHAAAARPRSDSGSSGGSSHHGLFRAAVLTVPTLDAAGGLRHDPTYGPHELGPPATTAAAATVAVDGALGSDSSRGSARQPGAAMEERRQQQLPDRQAAALGAVAGWCPYTRLAGAATAAAAAAATATAPPPQQRPPAPAPLRRPARPAEAAATWPALLLRTGLYDTNVPYWDPAKALAALRCCDALAAAAAGAKGAPTATTAAAAAGGQHGALRVMQVKPGGHDAFDSVADDALRAAFVLWALGVWRPTLPPPPPPVPSSVAATSASRSAALPAKPTATGQAKAGAARPPASRAGVPPGARPLLPPPPQEGRSMAPKPGTKGAAPGGPRPAGGGGGGATPRPDQRRG
ncbi:hypothetical protein HXX76_008365 [Chlamydomonas incerta]|uniref:Prolyl endopeptidase-like n=1 Tax=Chlamydomonas incerta TaxID=51695 RepID=A0A835SU85_CHLIN|nr:hypothetical protein HXX76_008365 [Chlamydomonas incerta]|eukprot:KAG2433299.1 hypothetical protein HXX76_008365 [Chlamydomonas incerta]